MSALRIARFRTGERKFMDSCFADVRSWSGATENANRAGRSESGALFLCARPRGRRSVPSRKIREKIKVGWRSVWQVRMRGAGVRNGVPRLFSTGEGHVLTEDFEAPFRPRASPGWVQPGHPRRESPL